MAKCPKCNAELKRLDAKPIAATLDNGNKHQSLVFCCPHCDVVISAQTSPEALVEYMKQTAAI